MDIVFVILNYNIVEETVNCVESIVKNIDSLNYQIIIVDNGSADGISSNVKKRLCNYDSLIEYIDLANNLGFAKGNNVGIRIAKKYEPLFVCCLNNDIEFVQKDFYHTLLKEYLDKKPAIIGPKVYLRDGSIQHFNERLLSVEEYQRQLEGYKAAVKKTFTTKIKNWLKDNEIAYLLYEKYYLNKKKNKCINNFEEEKYDVIIHGCCIIFTEIFLNTLEGFNDKTFLYREEELLYLSIIKNNMTSYYCPKLFIKHLEDVSTNSIAKKRSDKDYFYYKCQIDSINVLIAELLMRNN